MVTIFAVDTFGLGKIAYIFTIVGVVVLGTPAASRMRACAFVLEMVDAIAIVTVLGKRLYVTWTKVCQ